MVWLLLLVSIGGTGLDAVVSGTPTTYPTELACRAAARDAATVRRVAKTAAVYVPGYVHAAPRQK